MHACMHTYIHACLQPYHECVSAELQVMVQSDHGMSVRVWQWDGEACVSVSHTYVNHFLPRNLCILFQNMCVCSCVVCVSVTHTQHTHTHTHTHTQLSQHLTLRYGFKMLLHAAWCPSTTGVDTHLLPPKVAIDTLMRIREMWRRRESVGMADLNWSSWLIFVDGGGRSLWI
jgi:hypothetical protein